MSFKKHVLSSLGVFFCSLLISDNLQAAESTTADQSALKKAASEELKYENLIPAENSAPKKRGQKAPVVMDDSAQGILKLDNPYDNKDSRSYKLQLSFLGQKYKPQGAFDQEVGPDLKLGDYSELVLPSVELSTDKTFANNPSLSWGGHLGMSFITQTQRFSLGNSKTVSDDAQLSTLILQVGPNLKYRLHERIKWTAQISAGAIQQTMSSPSSYLRHSRTTSLWSAATGPEVMITSNTLATLRYEFRQLLSKDDNAETQNNNVQLGLGFLW